MKKSFGAKTLIFPAPVWCVGTYDAGDVPNIMTIAWGGIWYWKGSDEVIFICINSVSFQ